MTESVEPVSVAASPMSAVHVVFTGRVQGVGFRYTAAMLAREYPIGGWVRNLLDGGVALYAEGPPEALDKFLEAVRRRWRGNIRSEQAETRKPAGIYLSFDIAH